MNILFQRRFLKDIESVAEKSVKLTIENIILEIEAAQQLSQLQNLKKIKGHKSAFRIRIGNY